jgi:hypothetical protein
MPICYNNKYVFVHIPKTGGSSIISRLDVEKRIHSFTGHGMQILFKNILCVDGHIPAFLFKEIRPDIFDRFYRFSFIRNPYDRAVSEFLWIFRDEWKTQTYSLTDQEMKDKFEVWLFSYYIDKENSRKCTQKWYLFCKSKRRLLVNDIYKFENFESEFEKLTKKLNINPINIDILKQAKIEVDRNMLLTEKNKEYIYRVFQEDFETFGYPKEYVWNKKT